MRLRYSDIEQHIPPRGTVYVHHCKRGSGNDKLGITRLPDGTVKAHCFHCGARGTWRPEIRPLASLKELRSEVKKEFHLPKDCEEDISKWPGWAYAWVTKYGIRADELSRAGVAYSGRYDCVVLPCVGSAGLLGYQTRNGPNGPSEAPKYNSFRSGSYLYHLCRSIPGDHIVLVEDVLSALKVSRQFNSLALLTTHANPGALAELSKFKKFTVWLDNDNDHVLKARTKLVKTLELLGDVRVVADLDDPKKYTNEQIKEAVHGKASAQAVADSNTVEEI